MDILKKLDETFGDQPAAVGTVKLLEEQQRLLGRIAELERALRAASVCDSCGGPCFRVCGGNCGKDDGTGN